MSGSRYERELDELLASLGDWAPRETRAQRFQRRFRQWLAQWQESVARMRWTGMSVDQMMLGGIGLIVFAYFLRLAVPVGAAYVGLLGVLVFFASFALAIRNARRRRESRWRGRPISSYDQQTSLFYRLRSWWRRRTWG